MVMAANSCSENDAKSIVRDAANTCRELLEAVDLNYGDLEEACLDMGIECDHIEGLIEMLAY